MLFALTSDSRTPDSGLRDLARDPRYGHYARIPERVCRCLEHFGLAFDRAEVAERLGAYYLFVGVADDAIDAGSVHTGAAILEQLLADTAPPDPDTPAAPAPVEVAIDALRRHFGGTPPPPLRAALEGLYAAVVREREAATLAAYVAARASVGRLTAEVSYLLVRPLVAGGGGDEKLFRFLTKVGEVGCLLDSVLDLGADARHGLLGFRPTRRRRLRLAARTLREGAALLVRHPRLLPLFLAAAADTIRDRFKARGSESGVEDSSFALTPDTQLQTPDSL